MNTKFLVGYDGSEGSKRALNFAHERAVAAGATLIIAHVLEWSPYSFLTPDEIEERHKRRKQELARAEEALIKPTVAAITDVPAESVIKYGNIADTLNSIAKEVGATQIFISRSGDGDSFSSRIFGSTTGKLAAIAEVPCTIVP